MAVIDLLPLNFEFTLCCLICENITGPFKYVFLLCLAQCYASSVEGAGETFQEEALTGFWKSDFFPLFGPLLDTCETQLSPRLDTICFLQLLTEAVVVWL